MLLRFLQTFAVVGTLSLLVQACESSSRINEACTERACAAELTCCSDQVCRPKCTRPDGAPDGGGPAADAGQPDAGTSADAGPASPDAGAAACSLFDGGLIDAGCDDHTLRYAAALAAARGCNPYSLVEPCTERRAPQIDCGCPIPIGAGSGGELDRIACSYRALRAAGGSYGWDAGLYGCVGAVCPGCGMPGVGRCIPVPDGGPEEGRCELVP